MKKQYSVKITEKTALSGFAALTVFIAAFIVFSFICVPRVYADETQEEDTSRATTQEEGTVLSYSRDSDGYITGLTCTTDGEKYTDGWLEYEGNTYYFRGGGQAILDEFRKLTGPDGNEGYYYFNRKGQMFTGGFKKLAVNGIVAQYYFGEDGRAYTGGVRAAAHKKGGVSYYYFGAKGRATTDFYISELNDTIKDRITGISYPADDTNAAVHYSDLRYVHVLHYNFKHKVKEGEIICNKAIAEDLLEIFKELYENEYEIAKIRLIDEYGGDDDASCEDDNTSCFNYRVTTGGSTLSRHAYGMAIDINPYENPYVTKYNGDRPYADRSKDFEHKITTSDLCYKLFTERGFKWGGSWINIKDYQHFEKK